MKRLLAFVCVAIMVTSLGACTVESKNPNPTPSLVPPVTATSGQTPELFPVPPVIIPDIVPRGNGYALVARTFADSVDVYDAPDGVVVKTLIRSEVVYNFTDMVDDAMAFRILDYSQADKTHWVLAMTPVHGLTGWIHIDDRFEPLAWRELRIVVDKSDMNLCVFAYAQVGPIGCVPVSVGAPATPTPDGEFYVREKLRLPYVDEMYGSAQLLTNASSDWVEAKFNDGIAIHGNLDPKHCISEGIACSNGCIRLLDAAVLWLINSAEEGGVGVKSGTPVIIQE